MVRFAPGSGSPDLVPGRPRGDGSGRVRRLRPRGILRGGPGWASARRLRTTDDGPFAVDVATDGAGKRAAPPLPWLPAIRRHRRDEPPALQRRAEYLRRLSA